MSADNWQCPNCANVVSTLSAVCDNCGYDRRTMPDPTRREPETKSERAELQVSLLNEIGLTLAELSKRVDAMDIRTEVHLQRIEGRAETVQGLLVDLGSSRVRELNMLDGTDWAYDHLRDIAKIDGRTFVPESSQQKMLQEQFAGVATRLAQIEERLDKLKYERSTALENNVATLNKLVLSERSDRVIGKPRKAGKRKRVKR